MEKFSFSSALMHFRNSQGPSGFVWKWLLAYVLVFGLANTITGMISLYASYQAYEAAAQGDFRFTRPFSNIWLSVLPLPFFVAITASERTNSDCSAFFSAGQASSFSAPSQHCFS